MFKSFSTPQVPLPALTSCAGLAGSAKAAKKLKTIRRPCESTQPYKLLSRFCMCVSAPVRALALAPAGILPPCTISGLKAPSPRLHWFLDLKKKSGGVNGGGVKLRINLQRGLVGAMRDSDSRQDTATYIAPSMARVLLGGGSIRLIWTHCTRTQQ